MVISLKGSNQQLLRSGPEFTPHYAPSMQKHLRIPMDSFFVRSDLVSHWQMSLLYPFLVKSSGEEDYSVARILNSCKLSNVGYYFLFYTSLLGINYLHFPDWDFANILQRYCNSCLRGRVSICLDRTIIGPWKLRCLPKFSVCCWVFEQVESLWPGLQWGPGKKRTDDSYLDVWRVDTGQVRALISDLDDIWPRWSCAHAWPFVCIWNTWWLKCISLNNHAELCFCMDLLPYSALETIFKA